MNPLNPGSNGEHPRIDKLPTPECLPSEVSILYLSETLLG